MPRHPSSLEDKSTIVARNIDNSQYDNIKIVAGSIAYIDAIGITLLAYPDIANNLQIVTTPSNLTSLNNVSNNIDALTNVNTNINEVLNLESNLPQVLNVNSNILSVNTVSDNINAVNNVNDYMSDILITNANLTNINITATNIYDVNSVGSNIAIISNVNDELVMLNNINDNMSEILLGNHYATVASTKANEASISAASALNSELRMLAITSLDYAGFQVIDGELIVSYDDVNALPPQLVDGEFIVSYGV